MKQAADSANRSRVLQSTWLRHCRDALTPQAVPSAQALVFSSHVEESHFTWATGNLLTKTSGRFGSGAGRARCTPPRSCLSADRRYASCWEKRCCSGTGASPGEGLVVGNDARDLRTRTHEVEDIEGHAEPLGAPVEEVEVKIHLLDQGGVERL